MFPKANHNKPYILVVLDVIPFLKNRRMCLKSRNPLTIKGTKYIYKGNKVLNINILLLCA
jgi:hypothetical protein